MPSSVLAAKFLARLKQDGLGSTALHAARWMGFKAKRLVVPEKPVQLDPITQRRDELSLEINRQFDSTVRYGPLRGLKLVNDQWWGGADRGCMVLGLYEQEVLACLSDLRGAATFIDLGAADGYYGIGVLAGDLFETSYCYEMSESGRSVIQKNAVLNGVADRVRIRGTADRSFHTEFSPAELANCVLLVDIEGGEFELFDEAVFAAFRHATVIIEIHDWIDDAPQKIERLRRQAGSTHTIEILVTGRRDPSVFDELRLYNDDDRWLLCSEGRPRLMHWWVLRPIGAEARGAAS